MNPFDDISWDNPDDLDVVSTSSLKSPRMMVGTIESSISGKNVASGSCGHL